MSATTRSSGSGPAAGRSPPERSPADEHPDLAQPAVGIVQDLGANGEALRPRVLDVGVVDLAGEPRQRVRPALLEIVDRAAVVGAVVRGEAQDLDLLLPLLGGAPDSGVEPLQPLRLDLALREILAGLPLLVLLLLAAGQDLLKLFGLLLVGDPLQLLGAYHPGCGQHGHRSAS